MSQRKQRLADQIQREVASLIRLELKDPRLGMVTISSVKVSPDMGYADIYVTVLGHSLDDKPDESIRVLNAAAGFLRGEVGRAIRTRITPRLRFHYDEVTARGNRMATLISEAVRQDQERAKSRGDDESGKE
ncbi:MAG TPA: 30S ribosome-binding factor RbfA [Moraxellaceae bacterium]|nr:30S ribosome-binding factor RbfA [Moraxellaceae bacterium]